MDLILPRHAQLSDEVGTTFTSESTNLLSMATSTLVAFWAVTVLLIVVNSIRMAVMTLRKKLGEPAVMTADPELIRQIHAVNDSELFRSVLPEPAEVLLGNQSLLALSGEPHKRERKLLAPPFHRESLRKWAGTMATAGRRTPTSTTT